MKKIVWLSNVDLRDTNPRQTGTWIHSMYSALSERGEVQICAIFSFTSRPDFHSVKAEGITHYYIPFKKINRDGYPSREATDYVVEKILEESPELIHVWGVETSYGLMMGDSRLDGIKKLVDIQGVRSICAESQYFMGSISAADIVKMRSAFQRIFPIRRVESVQKSFLEWRPAEQQSLINIQNVNTQSEWVRTVLPSLVDIAEVNLFHTGIILRDSFVKSSPWYQVHKKGENPVLFTTTSDAPYKGLHVTLKAFAIVRKKWPDALLYVAGMEKWKPNFLRGGYKKYITLLVKELALDDSVVFLGNIDEKEMLEYMYKADVFVISSFVESYCLALAEASAVGVPVVSAYSTALTELVSDGLTGLLYPVGDHYLCARSIQRYLGDEAFSYEISRRASEFYRREKSSEKALELQMETYKTLLGE
ncbi:MAG: glycosyltransferase [Bacteroidales bacterium]|nr:glycosyltransferase [Bacteroidales bacterium]